MIMDHGGYGTGQRAAVLDSKAQRANSREEITTLKKGNVSARGQCKAAPDRGCDKRSEKEQMAHHAIYFYVSVVSHSGKSCPLLSFLLSSALDCTVGLNLLSIILCFPRPCRPFLY